MFSKSKKLIHNYLKNAFVFILSAFCLEKIQFYCFLYYCYYFRVFNGSLYTIYCIQTIIYFLLQLRTNFLKIFLYFYNEFNVLLEM